VPVAREHAFSDKSDLRLRIWRVVGVEPAGGDKSKRPIRICHILQVQETGERGLAVVAAAQRGLVHRSQLVALGIGRGSIAHRVGVGSLHPVLPSVFAVGHPALEPLAAEVAALLYVREDCVLSHRTAAAMWGFAQPSAGPVEITLAGRNVRQRPGLTVHRVQDLDARDVRLREGIPVTAPARTLIDLAAVGSDHDVVQAIAQARVLRLCSDPDLDAAMAECPGRTGTSRLRRILRSDAGPALTRSEGERRMLRLADQAQLPRPQVNTRLLNYEIDFLWQESKLVLEVDGHAFHAHRSAFESDRRRDQVLVAAGYRVVRVTWRQLVWEPIAVISRVAQALALAAEPRSRG